MKKKLAGLIAALLLLPALGWGEQKAGVELTSIAEVEIVQKNAYGIEELTRVLASSKPVPPGETVIFTISYINNGDQPATDIVINNPVPEQMTYVNMSAEGAGTRIDFSVDKGKTYGPVSSLTVKTSTGKEKPATAEDITNVRWTLNAPLPPGSRGRVSYRAKVK